MSKIKVLLASGASSAALMLGLAMPVGAQTVDCSVSGVGSPVCAATDNTDNSDNSDNRSYSCSIINPDQNNNANGAADGDGGSGGDGDDGGDVSNGGIGNDGNTSTGGAGGAGGAGGSGDGGSVSQSNALSLVCNTNTTTNNHITNAAAAASQVAATPVGGVKAGAGATEASAVSTVLGMGGSLATITAGAFLRKRNG